MYCVKFNKLFVVNNNLYCLMNIEAQAQSSIIKTHNLQSTKIDDTQTDTIGNNNSNK